MAITRLDVPWEAVFFDQPLLAETNFIPVETGPLPPVWFKILLACMGLGRQ